VRLAAERLWDLVGIADAMLARIHGSAQAVVEAFEAAIEDLGRLWSAAAGRQPAALARRVFAALQGEGHYLQLHLVQAMAAPLGPDGRAEPRSLVDHALAQLPESGDELSDWRNAVERRCWTAVLAMVADSEGDVDAYIDAAQRGGVAMVEATDIALRLIEAGRPKEALGWLDQAPGQPCGGRGYGGRPASRGPAGARTQGRGPGAALVQLYPVAARRSAARSPEAPAGLRGLRGGTAGDGAGRQARGSPSRASRMRK
jgi:hypothetical protein